MDSLIIKNSDIAKLGVFTDRDIKKSESVCFLQGEEISSEEVNKRIKKGSESVGNDFQIDNDKYIDLNNKHRAINHSCEPNCYVRGKNELVALKDIKKDEEITYDYSTTMWEEGEDIWWVMFCNCKSEKCRGIIDQFYLLPKDIQNYYIKNNYLPDFIKKKIQDKSKEITLYS